MYRSDDFDDDGLPLTNLLADMVERSLNGIAEVKKGRSRICFGNQPGQWTV